jgi:DedD protein
VERHVKERLIGAAVLMAAAIILIPEMLSGPERHEGEPVRSASDETSVKTYTIDLNRPPGTPQEPITAEVSPAPPPEKEQPLAAEQAAPDVSIPSNTSETNPESDTDSTTTKTQGAPSPQSSPPPAKVTESSRAVAAQPTPPPSAPQKPPRSVASEASVPTSPGWAVQLGSFSSRASADRLAGQFRADGYDVFVMPVETRKSTLYRVRIGPMRDRTGADEVLRRVRAKVAGAAVVAHP